MVYTFTEDRRSGIKTRRFKTKNKAKEERLKAYRKGVSVSRIKYSIATKNRYIVDGTAFTTRKKAEEFKKFNKSLGKSTGKIKVKSS